MRGAEVDVAGRDARGDAHELPERPHERPGEHDADDEREEQTDPDDARGVERRVVGGLRVRRQRDREDVRPRLRGQPRGHPALLRGARAVGERREAGLQRVERGLERRERVDDQLVR